MTPAERLSNQLYLSSVLKSKIFNDADFAGEVDFLRMTIDGLAPIFSVKREEDPNPYKLIFLLRLSKHFPYLDKSKPVHLFINSILTDQTMDIVSLHSLISHIKTGFDSHIKEIHEAMIQIFES